jgi:hypothetical protein
MDRKQTHAKLARIRHGAVHSFGDVVQLQIKERPTAKFSRNPRCARSGTNE